MAGSTLCVACAQLPLKDGSLSVKRMQCPDCKSEFGVTSYGAPFRIQVVKRSWLLSSTAITGMTVGAALFTFVMVLAGLGIWSSEKVIPVTPQADPPASTDLARVPEVAVTDRFPAKIQPTEAKQRISGFIETIKRTNTPQNTDAFVLANMKTRPELQGLPFAMGAACRLDMNKAQSFQASVEAVRHGQQADGHQSGRRGGHDSEHAPFWNTYLSETGNQGTNTDHGVAALTQILGPERKSMRADLVRKLGQSNTPVATRALARSAIFDADGDVRVAAIKMLKDGNKEQAAEVTEVLMQGIRYPMPIVAKRSAQAMIALKRQDLTPQLVAFLGEAAPGDPEEKQIDEQPACVVREVVRINHHRNCLLCHPPSTTGQPQEVPGVIPIPGTPFPSSPGEAYGQARNSGEPMIRADATYLRQDFSVMMPVENAAPWPEQQRFDFLVRTRVVEGKELAAMKQKVQSRPAGFLSENHKAALRVLEELTGQREVAPNQAAWQRALDVAKADE